MTSGVPKRILRTLRLRVRQRPKGNSPNRDLAGCVYLPEETIGHEVIIQIMEKVK